MAPKDVKISDTKMETGANLDIEKILEFIRKQDSSEKYEGVKKVVLLLGCTGNGKSTLTQLLTGNRNLRCVGSMGQYVIEDENGRIGSAGTTILSQTTYPENLPYPGSDTETFLLDCPGFRDTRNSSMDVACTIFTKRSLKNCLVAKIVLVISYEEVKLGGQRNAFLELVKHASEFVKDFEKFRSSIALFVTKVPNIVEPESRNREYVSDANMKKHIFQFLESVRETILAQIDIPAEKRNLYTNTMLLTNILLQSSPGNSRIGILRCPDRQGLLHEVSTIRQSKADLDDIIERVLEFTQISEDDFGYSISSDSKVCITESVKEITNTVTELLSKILGQIVDCYQMFENKTEDMETLYQNFSEHYTVWKRTADKLSSLVITREVFSCVLRHVEYLFSTELLKEFSCDEATTELTQNIAELNGYIELLELLETVSDQKYQIATSKLQTIFEKASNAVRSSNIWYQAFPKFYKQLTSYDVQQRKSSSSALNFMDALEKWIQGNTPISAEDFTDEFNAVYEGGLGVQLDFQISVIKLKRFHRLCKYAFVESTTYASGEFLKSVGNIVLLSSVPILDNEGVTDVEIFAGNKVFIDCDLDAVGKRLQIFIAAPEWEVVGDHRQLILDGAEGHPYQYPAEDGDDSGSNGKNGNPGQPGECGGNFFGIGDKMCNGKNLVVSSSGGKGGVGQAGGNGRPGLSGRDAETPGDQDKWFWESFSQMKKGLFKGTRKNGTELGFFCLRNFERNAYTFPGEDGQEGGNGGDGGCGGIGGFPGDVSFLGFKNDGLPLVVEKCGDCGEDGKGGKSGVGGNHGKSLEAIVEKNEPLLDLNLRKKLIFENIVDVHRGYASDGQNGNDGFSKLPLCRPKYNKNKNFPAAVLDYKLWFTENAKTNPIQSNFESFICRLEKVSKIADFGSIEALAAELARIELKIVRSASDIECKDEYTLLLYYIKCFFNNIIELTFDDAEAIWFLYIIALFRQNSDFSKITNLVEKARAIAGMAQELIFAAQYNGDEAEISEKPYSGLKFETNAFFEAIYETRRNYEMLVQEVDRIAGVSIPPCSAAFTEKQISNFVLISESKLPPTLESDEIFEELIPDEEIENRNIFGRILGSF